jgi:hypothetical protein
MIEFMKEPYAVTHPSTALPFRGKSMRWVKYNRTTLFTPYRRHLEPWPNVYSSTL